MSESATTEVPQVEGSAVVETPVVETPKPARKRAASKKSTAKKATPRKAASKSRERKTQALKPALIKRVHTMSSKGKKLQEIADALNKSGEKTARGLPWTTQNVWHVLRRKSS